MWVVVAGSTSIVGRNEANKCFWVIFGAPVAALVEVDGGPWVRCGGDREKKKHIQWKMKEGKGRRTFKLANTFNLCPLSRHKCPPTGVCHMASMQNGFSTVSEIIVGSTDAKLASAWPTQNTPLDTLLPSAWPMQNLA